MMWKALDYKRIAVLGDTHNNTEKVLKALQQQNIEYFLFTGDYYSDAVRLGRSLKLDFTGVFGNCDLLSDKKGDAKEEEFLYIGEKKVYVLHGHQYRVKESLTPLYYRALEIEADVVIFGHTHVPLYKEIDGILLLNPGSPAKPRQGYQGTYMIIDNGEDNFKIKITCL